MKILTTELNKLKAGTTIEIDDMMKECPDCNGKGIGGLHAKSQFGKCLNCNDNKVGKGTGKIPHEKGDVLTYCTKFHGGFITKEELICSYCIKLSVLSSKEGKLLVQEAK